MTFNGLSGLPASCPKSSRRSAKPSFQVHWSPTDILATASWTLILMARGKTSSATASAAKVAPGALSSNAKPGMAQAARGRLRNHSPSRRLACLLLPAHSHRRSQQQGRSRIESSSDALHHPRQTTLRRQSSRMASTTCSTSMADESIHRPMCGVSRARASARTAGGKLSE